MPWRATKDGCHHRDRLMMIVVVRSGRIDADHSPSRTVTFTYWIDWSRVPPRSKISSLDRSRRSLWAEAFTSRRRDALQSFEAKAHEFSRELKPTASQPLMMSVSMGRGAESEGRTRTPRGENWSPLSRSGDVLARPTTPPRTSGAPPVVGCPVSGREPLGFSRGRMSWTRRVLSR